MASVNFKSIKEALSDYQSEYFWVSLDKGKIKTGNQTGFYAGKIDEHLTFDISNNKALVNMSYNGALKGITMFRGCYRTDYAPGIWTFKDFTTSGPYSFSIRLEDTVYDLSKVDWPVRTSVLDNIFPISTVTFEQLKFTLIAFCPISEDGSKRHCAVVYGLMIENNSDKRIKGGAILPRVDTSKDWSVYRGANLYAVVTNSDNDTSAKEIAFELYPGQYVWIPSIITAPGSKDAVEINKLGTLHWLNSTWSYFKSVIGELKMPEDTFTAECFMRSVCQCMEFVDMDEYGDVIGATWGTYPTTMCIWAKDLNYGCMPLFMLEQELFKKCILWFQKYGVRHRSNRYEGGVLHSIGNSLASVAMAGFYYSSTDDREFFIHHPEIKTKSIQLLEEVNQSRKDKNVWLYPSRFISDGVSAGDYHTGTNIFIWFCFKSFSRVLDEVYGETSLAKAYSAIAIKMKEAIDTKCVIDGPYGKQYIEGINADGTVPKMEHDGEESDTTLIPVYGYESYDHEVYKNYTRFALSEHNEVYNPETRGIRWGVDATMTGYITGFANVVDKETMNGTTGYMTEIKKLVDMDGSFWWWPYFPKAKYGQVCRMYTGSDFNEFFDFDQKDYGGKSGWASGVFVCLFIQEILGVRYDAPTKTLSFRPFSPSSSFRWDNFRFGSGKFGVALTRTENTIVVEIFNQNSHDIECDLEIPVIEGAEVKAVTKNNYPFVEYTSGRFVGKSTVRVSNALLPFESVIFKVIY